MRKSIIALFLLVSLNLAACGARENPLTKADLDKLTYWVYQKKTPAVEACAKVWADKTTAKANDLKTCDFVADELAKQLTAGGFGDVKPEDVPFPDLWISFGEHMTASRANTYDAKKAADAFNLNDPKLEENRRKEEEYRHSRGLK